VLHVCKSTIINYFDCYNNSSFENKDQAGKFGTFTACITFSLTFSHTRLCRGTHGSLCLVYMVHFNLAVLPERANKYVLTEQIQPFGKFQMTMNIEQRCKEKKSFVVAILYPSKNLP